MSVRWVTFFLWAAVAASLVAWGLKLFVSAAPTPRDVRVADAGSALRGDMLRVIGADAAAPAATEQAAPAAAGDARFQLVGVVAPRVAGSGGDANPGGVAVIAVDGKPPKAFKPGASVDGQTVLKNVRARGADLGPRDGAATIALEIPPPAAAATGTLPAAGAGPSTAAPMPAPMTQALPVVPAPAPAALPQPAAAGSRVPQSGPMPQRAPAVPVAPPPTVSPGQAQPLVAPPTPSGPPGQQPVVINPTSGVPQEAGQIR